MPCTGGTRRRPCSIRTAASPCARRWGTPGPRRWLSCRELSSSVREEKRTRRPAISSALTGWGKRAECISSVSSVCWLRRTFPFSRGTGNPVFRPFGRGCASGGRKPLTFSRKVQHKPLLMLKAFVALGGKNVPEEQMTDILWPEAEGDLAHQSFATTLRRVRAMLGNEKAVSLREGCVKLDLRQCWVDAFAFETLVARIDDASYRGRVWPDKTCTANLAAKPIALDRGPVLPGEEQP